MFVAVLRRLVIMPVRLRLLRMHVFVCMGVRMGMVVHDITVPVLMLVPMGMFVTVPLFVAHRSIPLALDTGLRPMP